MAVYDINNPKHYKPCHYKKYIAYACMPEKGTAIVNKLKHLMTANLLGTTYVGVSNLPYYNEKLEQAQARFPDTVEYVSGETPIVLCRESNAGLELLTLSLRQFFARFKTANGGMPSLEQLKKGWVKVQFEPDPTENYVACFIPMWDIGVIPRTTDVYNAQGLRHGKGDFIVAKVNKAGAINMSSRFVVNGLSFVEMFNNTGFSQMLSKNPLDNHPLPNFTEAAPTQSYSFASLQERLAAHENGVEAMITVAPEYTIPATLLSVLAWAMVMAYVSFADSFGNLVAAWQRGMVRKNGDMTSGCRIGYNQPKSFEMCMQFERKTQDTVKRLKMLWHVEDLDIFVRVEGQTHGTGNGSILQQTKQIKTPFEANITQSDGLAWCIKNHQKLVKFFTDYIKKWWDSK